MQRHQSPSEGPASKQGGASSRQTRDLGVGGPRISGCAASSGYLAAPSQPAAPGPELQSGELPRRVQERNYRAPRPDGSGDRDPRTGPGDGGSGLGPVISLAGTGGKWVSVVAGVGAEANAWTPSV